MISDDLRRLIKFRNFNLRDIHFDDDLSKSLICSGEPMESVGLKNHFDVIFCRNVMIYFDFDAQQKLVNDLYECLKPGGYLFTGDAELLHIYRHRFETVEGEGSFFYRKKKIRI